MDGGFIGFVAEVQDCIVSWCNAFRLGIFFTDGVAAHGEALGAEAVEEELGLHVYSCQDHVGGVICCVLAPVDAGTGVGENNDSLFFAFLQHGDGALHAFMDLINPVCCKCGQFVVIPYGACRTVIFRVICIRSQD